MVIPDSEDEEEGASWHCITASQAVVDGVLQEAGAAPSPRGGGAAQPALAAVDASWRDAVVLRGPAELTLLLPRDGRGELGLDTRCIPLGGPGQPRALTAAGALAAVHSFYAEALQPEEQLQLLQAFPGAEGAGAALRGAFLELAPLPRGALLGPRCRFEGLRKATRDPAGAVYELQLGW